MKETETNKNVPSKTPEEIKVSLRRCSQSSECLKCSYYIAHDIKQTCLDNLLPDVLALIEQLESHSHKWTSVAEHLPPTPGKYLVYSKVGTMYTSKFDPNIHKRWPHFGKVGVTHWMPRPEEPKE